jgi:hypothetical protein
LSQNRVITNRPTAAAAEVRELRGFSVDWAEAGNVVVSRGMSLFSASSLQSPRTFLGRVPAGVLRTAFAVSRSATRALRDVVYNAVPLPSGALFITAGRSVGLLRSGHFMPLQGIERQVRILRGACARSRDTVYFGEYFRNPRRESVRIYKFTDGDDRAHVVHEFAAGTVRHVHGVYADPLDGSLWVTVGDLEHECRILRTEDAFATLDTIGGGDETWRCVSVQFTDDAIVYAMDAEFRPNWLYRVDRKTGKRDALQQIDGPVYYSSSAGSTLFFAVTAEACPSHEGNHASLWRVSPLGEVERIALFPKDGWPHRYFMNGTLDFPAGPGIPNQLVFHTTAVVPDDRTFVISA